MFFLKEMEHEVTLSPNYFASGLTDLIRHALYRQLEGTCDGRHGYIVAILALDSISKGVIRGSSGGLLVTQGSMALASTATFCVKFKAIIYRPFKGEVVDAIIRTVNKMGFFAEAGPVQIFVSYHSIPTRFSFDPSAVPAAFISIDQTEMIVVGARVRTRIVGLRVDATEIFAIGSIKEEYLGLVV